jgi:hypothetical protein
MATMQAALAGLNQALDAPRLQGVALGNWRWVVRQRMAGVRETLANEQPPNVECWLAHRAGAIRKERNLLLGRLGALGPQVLEASDPEQVRVEMKRLLADISHHLQRLHDLAYDDVEYEVGGSE